MASEAPASGPSPSSVPALSEAGTEEQPIRLHACSLCSKSYKRREHLNRHVSVSHSSSPAHQNRCPWCRKTYQRTDVLRRHIDSCQRKAIGGSNYGGRLFGAPTARRRACDRCVRQKRACNSVQPCSNCHKKGVPCCYSGSTRKPLATSTASVSTASSSHGNQNGNGNDSATISLSVPDKAQPPTSQEPLQKPPCPAKSDPYFNLSELASTASKEDRQWLDFLSFSLSPENVSSSPAQAGPEPRRFYFLDSMTREGGLAVVFDCSTLEMRKAVLAAFHESDPAMPRTSLDITPMLFSLQDPLLTKTHQILRRVKEVVFSKARNSCVTMEWSVSLEQQCLAFFSPPNLRKMLHLYWSIWHPNVNIMHRPSFHPADTKTVLVASMTVLAACISPDSTDNREARPWFNCVEEMVFTDDDFCSEPLYTSDSTTVDPLTNMKKIQALQAGYMVCLIQNWEGTDASKRRIRRHRFNTLVAVARDMGIASARHRDYGPLVSVHDFDWKDYVAREEMIRLFLWIFLLDHAFGIFNNLPPRMVINEMDMRGAWPESAFQASTAGQCALAIQEWQNRSWPQLTLTVRETIDVFCKGPLSDDSLHQFADAGPLNLFVTVSAIHTIVFMQQNSSFGCMEQLQPVRTALRNWKRVWDVYSSELASGPPHEMVHQAELEPWTMWRRIGFMRYSPEYWLLATILVDRMSSPAVDARKEDSNNNNNNNHGHHHHQHAAVPSTSSSSAGPVFDKYDQTSMRQVNDLIAEFQHVQID